MLDQSKGERIFYPQTSITKDYGKTREDRQEEREMRLENQGSSTIGVSEQ
jgi:hypothetical protein